MDVLALELLLLVGQTVRLESVAAVSHPGQQQVDVLAVSSAVQSSLTPVVAIQQVDGRTQRPALVDANAAELHTDKATVEGEDSDS